MIGRHDVCWMAVIFRKRTLCSTFRSHLTLINRLHSCHGTPKKPSPFSNEATNASTAATDPFYNYTSGRWMFNESLRLADRQLKFDEKALKSAIASAACRPISAMTDFQKIAEGGFNRTIQATFSDGYKVLARLPYPMTQPKHYAVASEVATLALLRCHDIPVQKVLGYSSSQSNAAGVEYMLLEKLEGKPLSNTWFELDTKTRLKIMKQIVLLERKFFDIKLPGSGSIYCRSDLNEKESTKSLPIEFNTEVGDDLVIGPISRYSWWYQQRAMMQMDKGPWRAFAQAFEAPAKREIDWCMTYGKARLQAERCIREMTNFCASSPNVHTRLLSDYLTLSPYLDIPSQNELARPVLRHPDLSPSNILISPENDIVGLIDWQHAVVLPLCLTGGIPAPFQNYGDPVSEMMLKPEVKLPADFDQKTTEEQAEIRETMRKRAVHFLYAAFSKTQNPANWSAISDSSSILRSKLYNRAAQPWEGDSVPLKAALIEILQQWPPKLQGKSLSTTPPIEYGEAEMKECLDLESRQDERISEVQVMRDSLGCDGYGHCESDQHLAFAKDMAEKIRAGILAASDTEAERKSVLEHWPFDDHDEEE